VVLAENRKNKVRSLNTKTTLAGVQPKKPTKTKLTKHGTARVRGGGRKLAQVIPHSQPHTPKGVADKTARAEKLH